MTRRETARAATGAGVAERFRAARRDPRRALLEGLHPLKHALRFGAAIELAVTASRERTLALAGRLAPDLVGSLAGFLEEVPPAVFERLAPAPAPTGVAAIAYRPESDVESLLATSNARPVVLLEEPRHFGNLGAVVRTAAAAGAAGVLTTGTADPWHPTALRGSAGLHFALPVARIEALPSTARPIVALDPEGEPFAAEKVPPGALLAFGSERRGLGAELLDRSAARLALPMAQGVSSLNLGAAVAAVLYAWRLGGAPDAL